MQVNLIRSDLQKISNPAKAKHLMRFFKTGPGEYGEGDKFLGITVPDQKAIAKKYYKDIPLVEVKELLQSPIHEERLVALTILVLKFKKADESVRKDIYDFYLANTKYINNWDLVDLSAHYIVGAYLEDKDRSTLHKLAKSNDLWEKRISIVSTWYYIREGEYKDTFAIAEILLHDKHDLIHKAVGWMLREVGKKSGEDILKSFLDKHYKVMPRTMLRYSVEKFDEKTRKHYLSREN